MATVTYRPDVDGLRGISILGVMLFHANPAWLGAGYLGVDVFFVISGFLITSIIAGEMEQGTFTIGRFYERRVRRIFPALFVMLFASMSAAYALLLPQDLVSFAKSAIGVATFSSNLVFAGRVGYFDQDAHLSSAGARIVVEKCLEALR